MLLNKIRQSSLKNMNTPGITALGPNESRATSMGWNGNDNKDYWENAWKSGINPGERFDCMSPTPILKRMVKENKIPTGLALVPGCGRGYDVECLTSVNREVIGLDFSNSSVIEAKKYLNTKKLNGKWDVVEADFFKYDRRASFDFIYDYTFLCALEPSMREKWAHKMFELLKPNGILMTLIFPIIPGCSGTQNPILDSITEENEKFKQTIGGPPFLVSIELLRGLLTQNKEFKFEEVETRMMNDEECHKPRAGRCAIGLWVKKV